MCESRVAGEANFVLVIGAEATPSEPRHTRILQISPKHVENFTASFLLQYSCNMSPDKSVDDTRGVFTRHAWSGKDEMRFNERTKAGTTIPHWASLELIQKSMTRRWHHNTADASAAAINSMLQIYQWSVQGQTA